MSGIGLLLVQLCHVLGGPAAVGGRGQILLEPDHQLGFHGCESGGEDPDLDRKLVVIAPVTSLTPDGADEPVRVVGGAQVRRDVADLPADQGVRPPRDRSILDAVRLGHAGWHHPRESTETPALASRRHQLLSDRALHFWIAHHAPSSLWWASPRRRRPATSRMIPTTTTTMPM
jgi:hypothetical protein